MKLEKQIKNTINSLDNMDNLRLAILFGSQAKGNYNDNSDIDIAFLYDDYYLNNIDRLELRVDLIDIFTSSLNKDCDIVLINEAPLTLKYQIVKYGKLLYIRENESYNAFFSRVLKEYFDFRYFQDLHYNLMLKRIKEGEKLNG